MTIKKGIPETISQVPETNNESTLDNTFSNVIKPSEKSGEAVLFAQNQKLYDNGRISKDCYIAIERTVVEFMHFDEQFERGLITKDLRNECAAYEAAEVGDVE